MATAKQPNKRDCLRCFRALSWKYDVNFDSFFYRLGRLVGSHPIIALSLSLTVCVLSSFGLLLWREELDNVELFMPRDSKVRSDAAWVERHFRDDLLFESVIVEADNVLTPSVLNVIADLEMAVRAINVSNQGWKDVCAGYLTWFQDTDPEEYADEIKQAMKSGMFRNECIYQSVLKLWAINGSLDYVRRVNKETILQNVTRALNDSTVHLNVVEEVGPLLSGIEFDENGTVVKAKATILNWMLKKSNTFSPEWELGFIQQTLFSNRSIPQGVKIYAVSTRSYDDFLHEVLQNNITVLFAGFSLIILYVVYMLGRCNIIQQRIYLSLLGVSVVGQSILASYGLCFYMGFFWGPIHPILPFLLLGIGVDNTFVIMECLENLSPKDKSGSVAERIGRALEHAGVSITVTSLTDILAFAVGTSTVMPFLRSFCVFASVGIFCLYIFELFFFVSCLALDEYRIHAERDGCCCRIRQDWKPQSCSQKDIQKMIFTKYVGPFLMKTPVKILILMITLTVFGCNLWCVLQVEQKFDPIWYLNPESYPIKYNQKLNEYFPQYGKRAGVYIGGINYFTDKEKLNDLFSKLLHNPYINKPTVDFWYPVFLQWLSQKNYEPENEDEMKAYITEFLLFTREGQAYVKDIKFSHIPFGDYNITATQIPVQHIVLNTTDEQVKAMESMQQIVQSVNFSTEGEFVVAFSPEYVSWTANKIIGEELVRNLGLTIAAVAFVTFVLIQNLKTTLWVNACVIFTVIDLVGSMYWLGLTIEISTSIMVLLCAGLAVDYAAHIGHEFVRQQGTKDERAKKTVSVIGSAVFNGGFSTFLAFCLLGSSHSYLFTTFFKLFTGVVVFGVFHGLLFLPVALSWFGPSARQFQDIEVNSSYTVPTENQNGFFEPGSQSKEDMVLRNQQPGLISDVESAHQVRSLLNSSLDKAQ